MNNVVMPVLNGVVDQREEFSLEDELKGTETLSQNEARIKTAQKGAVERLSGKYEIGRRAIIYFTNRNNVLVDSYTYGDVDGLVLAHDTPMLTDFNEMPIRQVQISDPLYNSVVFVGPVEKGVVLPFTGGRKKYMEEIIPRFKEDLRSSDKPGRGLGKAGLVEVGAATALGLVGLVGWYLLLGLSVDPESVHLLGRNENGLYSKHGFGQVHDLGVELKPSTGLYIASLS